MKRTINVGSLLRLIQQNVSIILWPFLALVIIVEIFVIKGSVDLVLRVRNQPPSFQTQVVRVNTSQYSELEKQLQDNMQYQPKDTSVASPFGVSPKAP